MIASTGFSLSVVRLDHFGVRANARTGAERFGLGRHESSRAVRGGRAVRHGFLVNRGGPPTDDGDDDV
jgi:hypothetical protein